MTPERRMLAARFKPRSILLEETPNFGVPVSHAGITDPGGVAALKA